MEAQLTDTSAARYIGTRVGYRFSCTYIILNFTFYELDPITDTNLI